MSSAYTTSASQVNFCIACDAWVYIFGQTNRNYVTGQTLQLTDGYETIYLVR